VKERIRFHGAGDFSRLLNERAEIVLGDAATMRRAYRTLWAKSALVMAWAVTSYLLLLLVVTTPAAVVTASISLGLAAAAIGFCVMHDANHGGYSTSRSVNRVAAHSLDLIGGSSYVWSAKHLAHHTYTNVADHDPDIDALPFARFEPTQRRRPWHRYQHLYMWFLYAFVTLRWQTFTDATFLARGSVGRSRFKRPRGWDLVGLVAGKALFATWAVAIPLLLHTPAHVLLVFLCVSAVASLALTVTFQLLLTLVSSSNAENAETLWGFIGRYRPGVTPQTHPKLDAMVGYAINYYRDFVAPTKRFREPIETERKALSVKSHSSSVPSFLSGRVESSKRASMPKRS